MRAENNKPRCGGGSIFCYRWQQDQAIVGLMTVKDKKWTDGW